MLYQIKKTKTGEIRAFQHDSYSNTDIPLSKKEALEGIRLLTEYLRDDNIDMYHDIVREIAHFRHYNPRVNTTEWRMERIEDTYGEKLNELPPYVEEHLKEIHEVIEESKRTDYLETGYLRYRESKISKEMKEAVELEYMFPTKRPKKGTVYFLQEDKTQTIKIGYTKDLEQRLKAFATLPFELKPLIYIKTNDANELENWFHSHFEDKRIDGEWFKLNRSDLRYVTSGDFKENVTYYEDLEWRIDKESPYYKEVVNK